jgi:NADP-reducing hydrogenase subunit HndC
MSMTGQVIAAYGKVVEKCEYLLQQRDELGKIAVQIGSATCENAAGANDIYQEFQKHVVSSGRTDISLTRTGCTGRCSCEPIVRVIFPRRVPVKYERVNREIVHQIFTRHVLGGQPVAEYLLDHPAEDARVKYDFLFCGGVRCGCDLEQARFQDLFHQKLTASGVDPKSYSIIRANCFGLCRAEDLGQVTHILVRPDKVIYRIRNEADLDEIIQSHVGAGRIVERLRVSDEPIGQRFFELYGDNAFFNRQSRIALRNSGVIDPDSIQEYIHFGGFKPFAVALDRNDSQAVIREITESKIRGRGGGGYPTGVKWGMAAAEKEPVKYIICNADEGDPGAFMDRSMLEGDPFSVLEGMMIGAFAIGASRGFFYVRAEYPMAIKRIQNAIDQARRHGLLGDNILGSDFSFDVEIRLGAGAFVCGEETALIHSIEGQRGQPRIRPPYPTQQGLWHKPTVINNVETFANIPVILDYGASWFSRIGTEKSGGTKVFALAGKVKHTGLVEVPMGTTLREIVFHIGGGIPDGKKIKAIQTGGPAGGCIPAQFLDTVVDFDSLMAVGSIMGSGGMIVMDEDDCMVDIAKFFITFSQDESCGKCTPCREGSKRMLEILERITSGKGVPEDVAKLERLGLLMKRASLCGLGRAAANPVLSTLRYFRDEYDAHVINHRCPARKCTAMIHYNISSVKCVGCTACARNCPVQCIAGQPKKLHVIDQIRCIKCGRCFQVCRFNAVDRE